jgi:hypothetical protein
MPENDRLQFLKLVKSQISTNTLRGHHWLVSIMKTISGTSILVYCYTLFPNYSSLLGRIIRIEVVGKLEPNDFCVALRGFA